jgi:hypothetical protein
MAKNIILESDSFNPNKLKNWISYNNVNNQYKIYVLTRISRHEKFKSELKGLDNVICVSYDQIFKYSSKEKINLNLYTSFISSFLNDHITARFIDRGSLWSKEYGVGVQNTFSYYTFSSYGMFSFLIDNNISIVYFRNTPHEPKEWILAKAADFLNIDIFTSERFVFPWLYTICRGFGKERELLLQGKAFNDSKLLNTHIEKYLNKIKGKYSDAIPSYEKNRLGKGILKFYNPFKNINQSIKRLDNFVNKTRIFFYYKKHRQYIDLKQSDYIVFFLHFQPERTTLPEGYDFVDQFYAISILSRMLPVGVKLLVKEHPSMFTVNSDVRARNIYNYKQILKLENVLLCPMNYDIFNLIDHAKAVSTITGNVAVESFTRKTPVILFGRSLLDVDGVHLYKDVNSLQIFINKVFNNEINIEDVVSTFVNLCSKNNISGLDLSLNEEIDYHNFKGFQENAHYKLLTEVLIKQSETS